MELTHKEIYQGQKTTITTLEKIVAYLESIIVGIA